MVVIKIWSVILETYEQLCFSYSGKLCDNLPLACFLHTAGTHRISFDYNDQEKVARNFISLADLKAVSFLSDLTNKDLLSFLYFFPFSHF